ncbi:MAG TPA: hypothetical protein VMH26_08645 [Burkholderiales bacterium]|nr:hypothetical protein [Burkholderiales bacterium]
MTQPKVSNPAKRRSGLLQLPLRLPARHERATRSQDLGDLRLQFLLDATSLPR